MKIRNANRKQRLKRIIESILEKIIKAVLCGGMLVSVIVLGVILFALLSFAGRLLLMDSKQRKPSAAQEDIVSIINVIDVPSISENNCNMELLLEPEYSGAAEPPFRKYEYRKSGIAYRQCFSCCTSLLA